MKLIVNLLLLACPIFLIAQTTQGTVSYTEENSFEIKLEGMDESMQKLFPSSMKDKKVLYFNQESAVYESAPEAEDEEEEYSSGGMNIRIHKRRSRTKIHTSFADNEKLEFREFRSRNFLINEALEPFPWKITAEQKMLLDMPCQKATFQDSTKTVTAWFTPAIPVPAGPGLYGQLPGLILEMNIEEEKSKTHILATAINTDAVDEQKLRKPKKGKKVTRTKFNEIVEQKKKEMQEMYGKKGSGTVIRIID